jgi:hypothetical protein
MAAGIMAARVMAAGIMSAGIMAAGITALSVFFGLEILDSDRFLTFFCCHFIFLSGWFVLCQERRRAIDARL